MLGLQALSRKRSSGAELPSAAGAAGAGAVLAAPRAVVLCTKKGGATHPPKLGLGIKCYSLGGALPGSKAPVSALRDNDQFKTRLCFKQRKEDAAEHGHDTGEQ